MSTITFPKVLASAADLPTHQFDTSGDTLRDSIKKLCKDYGELGPHLFHANEELKEHFLFVANGVVVDPDEQLPEQSDIEVLLAASGGNGPAVESLSNDEVRRYVRHITLPDIGRAGQLRLKQARILVVGTGGLGSPALLYLAAAGVGTLGLIDHDVVEESNLQRQVVHGHRSLGQRKVDSARERLLELNSRISIEVYDERFEAENAEAMMNKYDIVLDGTDNFATRYLINDTAVALGKPLVHGSVQRFDGQVSVFNYRGGPCYRCLFPANPPSELAPSCSAGGVLGVLPGVIGMLQATEAIKLVLELGEPLVGRLLRFNAMTMRFSEVSFERRDTCQGCAAQNPMKSLTSTENAESAATERIRSDEMYLDPKVLRKALDTDADPMVLLDVRDANELEVCQLDQVVHIPLTQLKRRLNELDPVRPHCVICYGGTRAERAADTLIDAGFSETRVLRGGMKGWVREVEPDMPIY